MSEDKAFRGKRLSRADFYKEFPHLRPATGPYSLNPDAPVPDTDVVVTPAPLPEPEPEIVSAPVAVDAVAEPLPVPEPEPVMEPETGPPELVFEHIDEEGETFELVLPEPDPVEVPEAEVEPEPEPPAEVMAEVTEEVAMETEPPETVPPAPEPAAPETLPDPETEMDESTALAKILHWLRRKERYIPFGELMQEYLQARGKGAQQEASVAMGYKNRGQLGNLLKGRNGVWTEERLHALLHYLKLPGSTVVTKLKSYGYNL